jgi:lipoprotein-releasing system ATP-binding protein
MTGRAENSNRLRLAVRHVRKEFDSAPPLVVLKDVSFELDAGETLSIIGPSGAGKSTLLNIVGSLDRPTGGSVALGETEVTALEGTALADFRSRRVGFVFQDHHLLPQCSAIENVLLPTLALPPASRDSASRARELLERVGLKYRLHSFPAQLSGGERQRVAVVRGLINQPRLLLADEPTGALDRAAAEALARLLVELNREERVTLMVATHALDLAERMGRRFQLLDGRLA